MNLRNVRILGLTGQDRTEMSHVSPYQIYGFGDRNEPCKPILDIYMALETGIIHVSPCRRHGIGRILIDRNDPSILSIPSGSTGHCTR